MASHRPVRFAYVGCGFVAQNIHIPNFASLPECQFMALAEVREDLGEKVAKYYGIPQVYKSHEEIAADPDIEAVGVSGPYALQGAIAKDLLAAGKHVFMEKPMAVSVAQARQLVDAERASGKRLMVGYMKRYDAGNKIIKAYAKQWLESGEMGRLMLARNHGFGGNWVFAQDPNVVNLQAAPGGTPPPPAPDECPEWLPAKWKDTYLGYLQQWTHNLNLVRYFLGDDEGTAKVTDVSLDDDGMTGLVILDIKGHRATVESGYTNFHGWEEHTQLYFQKGWLRTEAPALLQKNTPATVEVYRAPEGNQIASKTQEFPVPSWAFREEAKHFLSGVAMDEPFLSPASDTLTDVRLYEEIYRAFLSRRGEL